VPARPPPASALVLRTHVCVYMYVRMCRYMYVRMQYASPASVRENLTALSATQVVSSKLGSR